MNKLWIIDGHFLLYKSYYVSLKMKNRTNLSVNDDYKITYLFLLQIWKVIKKYNPSHFFIAFDSKEKSFRKKLYNDYKIQRKGMPEELINQISIIKDVLDSLNIKYNSIPGYEADDIIASYVNKLTDESLIIKVLSNDNDLLQLVQKNVEIVQTKKYSTIYISNNNFYNVFQLNPNQIILYKSIVGDTSDNIKGVPGIGKITATKIISDYCTIDDLLSKIEEIKNKNTAQKILNNIEVLRHNYNLITLVNNIKIKYTLSELEFNRKNINHIKYNKLCEKLHLNSLII